MRYKILPILLLILLPFALTSSGQEITPVVLTNIEIVTVEDTSFSVSWVTNVQSDTRIQWGESANLTEEAVVDESGTCHIIFANGLIPGKTYHFRIGSGGRWSDIDTITTTDPNGSWSGTRVALVADIHYDADGINSPSGMMTGESDEIVDSLVSEINERDIDLVIFLGDTVNGGAEDYEGISPMLERLTAPRYYVFGNWEKYQEGWRDSASRYLGIDDTFTSFDVGDYHFVIIDSAVTGEIGGSINRTQLDWFESDLASNPYKPTIVLFHHVIDGEGVMGLDQASKDELLSILARNGQVISVINGHNHKNVRTVGGNQRDQITVASVIQYPIGYSIIDLYDEGYSQSFYKVEGTLSISEESRILIDARSASPQEDEEYLGTMYDRNIYYQMPEDHPPVIESISIDPEMVYPKEKSVITLDAYDPDHEEIEYNYEVDSGKITGSGPEVNWEAPEFPGVYEVRIYLSSGISQINATGQLIVLEEGGEIPNRPPYINSLSASKYTIQTGETVDIITDGSDPDGDDLSYTYSASGGQIIGEGASVKWKAPGSPGDYKITATISDGEIHSDPTEITITVIDSVTPSGEDARSTPVSDPLTMLLIFFTGIPVMRMISKRHRKIYRDN